MSPVLRGRAALLVLLLLAPAPPRLRAQVPAEARLAPGASRLATLGRLLELEDGRVAGSPELEGALRSPDRGIRRRAALAAGRIGDRATVPALVELLTDGEAEVRQMAAFALGLMGDPRATEGLALALQDPEAVVRARAAEALGRAGDARAGAAIARALLAWTPGQERPLSVRGDDPANPRDPWLPQRLALFALVKLKDVAAAETALLEDGRPRFDWWAATWAAMRLESARLRPVLAAAATSSDPVSRGLAARGLGALKDAASLPTLVALATDPSEFVAVHALRALGTLGDAGATDVLAQALRSPNRTLAWEALRSLAQVPPDRRLRPAVLAFLGHDDAWLHAAALPALARIDREEFTLVLSGLDPDERWWVRAATAGALAQAGDDVSLGALEAMLKDEDARVLPAVLEALRAANTPGTSDVLRRYLDHPHSAVRAAAAEQLVALKASNLAPSLAAAYRAATADGDLDARLALIDVLAAQEDGRAAAVLAEAAQGDPARVARARAAAALAARGQPAPDPGPEGPGLPPFDYREAMAPYDPRPGRVLYTPRAFLHTRHGVIEIHLDVVEAPLTSLNFVTLARRGFYDGLAFHRVIPHFVAQGGDPRGDGSGGPGYVIRDEVGHRPFARGAVGMALGGRDTGGSQFFITLSPQPHLDGAFTVFGWVAQGMDVADKLRPGDLIERVSVWTGP
jgi:cyclophilin family peptidyl-prolyl cis-trans isomerase/HEAT repeat protein